MCSYEIHIDILVFAKNKKSTQNYFLKILSTYVRNCYMNDIYCFPTANICIEQIND